MPTKSQTKGTLAAPMRPQPWPALNLIDAVLGGAAELTGRRLALPALNCSGVDDGMLQPGALPCMLPPLLLPPPPIPPPGAAYGAQNQGALRVSTRMRSLIALSWLTHSSAFSTVTCGPSSRASSA